MNGDMTRIWEIQKLKSEIYQEPGKVGDTQSGRNEVDAGSILSSG